MLPFRKKKQSRIENPLSFVIKIVIKKAYVLNLRHFQDEMVHFLSSKRWRSEAKMLIKYATMNDFTHLLTIIRKVIYKIISHILMLTFYVSYY